MPVLPLHAHRGGWFLSEANVPSHPGMLGKCVILLQRQRNEKRKQLIPLRILSWTISVLPLHVRRGG
eukprot:12423260-Karenia_brevis.AAC.1